MPITMPSRKVTDVLSGELRIVLDRRPVEFAQAMQLVRQGARVTTYNREGSSLLSKITQMNSNGRYDAEIAELIQILEVQAKDDEHQRKVDALNDAESSVKWTNYAMYTFIGIGAFFLLLSPLAPIGLLVTALCALAVAGLCFALNTNYENALDKLSAEVSTKKINASVDTHSHVSNYLAARPVQSSASANPLVNGELEALHTNAALLASLDENDNRAHSEASAARTTAATRTSASLIDLSPDTFTPELRAAPVPR